MEDKKFSEMNMRYTAENLKERLLKELPVMRENYSLLQSSRYGFSFNLPLIIHNISVCISERVYLFIEPTLRIYKAVLQDKQNRERLKRTGNDKELNKRIEFLNELAEKERVLYNEQLNESMDDMHRETKEIGTSEQSIVPLSERIENFQHIEIDMYEFLFPYMMLVIKGEIEQNDSQLNELHIMQEIALSIYKEFIPKREKALETCNIVLQSNVN